MEKNKLLKEIIYNRHRLDRGYLSGVINYDDFILLDKYLEIAEMELNLMEKKR